MPFGVRDHVLCGLLRVPDQLFAARFAEYVSDQQTCGQNDYTDKNINYDIPFYVSQPLSRLLSCPYSTRTENMSAKHAYFANAHVSQTDPRPA
jgi:hypothetical protein